MLVVTLTVGLLAAGAFTGGPRTAAAAPAALPTELVYLQNLVTGNQAAADGSGRTVMVNPPKGGEDHQQWRLETTGSGTVQIKNSDWPTLCLGRRGTSDLTTLRDCGADTEWRFTPLAGDRYRITEPGSGAHLADVGNAFSLAPGAGNEATWFVTPIAPVTSPMPADPTYDQMTYLTTHNSYQNTEDLSAPFAPNQPHSIQAQLEFGVRGLMIDVYDVHGVVGMCHKKAACEALGYKRFSQALTTIDTWLRANPNEVVTVFLEDYLTEAKLRTEFEGATGLRELIYNPEASEVRKDGWPKVSEMVRTNKRLVVFSSSNVLSDYGVMRQSDWTVENHWSMGPGLGNSDWTCTTRWGHVPLVAEEPGFRRLFVMNHFRDLPMAPTYGNDNRKLQDRAERFCMPAARKKPNFLAIDQYKDGDPMAAVTALNRYTYRGETPGHGVPTRPQWRVPRLAVMPLGDSITQGVGSSAGNGYRAELRNLLNRHATTVDFVGSLRHGTHADAEHEGHSGFRIDQIAAGIGPWLLAARPNVVTLHLGSNDINRDYHVAGAPARLAELIDQIVTAAPDVTVLVAPIVPNSRAGAQPRVDAFNRALPQLVHERQTKGHKVRLVDFGALNNADLADGLHPNDSGYQKMAEAFYAGLTGAAQENLITENVPVHPVPPTSGLHGDYDVDLDGDGKADYLVVGPNGSVDAHQNVDGKGAWTKLGQVATGSTQWSDWQVRFADL
ncbi:GDSL-type esterase/lipase family protein, partial [Streptomyces sp. NPDC005955]|uniref:GDSL-type esterase/lipase family protein n=1 Tax=Streptomyces sp. NPDC005955 TaxID=3364738 RepID=UPI0036959F00